MVQVYCEGLYKRHHAGLVSLPVALRVAVLAAAVIVSLAIAIATGNFWPKLATDIEQPTVHWTGDGLAILEGAQLGQEQVWTTSQQVQGLLAGKLVSASVQVGEVDSNFDGRPDLLRLVARVSSSSPVHSFRMLLQLRYTLRAATQLDMYCLVYLSGSTPLPGASFTTRGRLELRTGEPLARSNPLLLYNQSLLRSPATREEAVQLDAALHMDTILAAYASRNVTAVFTNDFPVWKAGNGDTFTIDASIAIPSHQLVIYRPPLGQMLKWGWVQFVATFAAVWWVASRAEAWVFANRVLDTRTHLDVAPKLQRF